jgi:ABC-type glycerol-3-phosphate transport system substrate-binding protein
LYPKLQAALATNSPPEVLFRDSNGDNVAALFNQGLMAPMNDVMDDIYKAIGGKDKFDAAAIDRYTLPTGEVIGMPYVGAPFVWWYRSDLLQQVGLTPPSGHWDWNFLLNAVKATHKPPNVYGFAVALGRNAAVQAFIGALILSNGGHFVSPDLKDVVFDSPEVRESIDLIRELAQYAPPDATTWGYAEEVTALLNGNSMTLYTGRILQSVLNMSPDLVGKISNTLTPYNKDPRSFTGMGSHGVFKGSKNLPGAKELAKFSSRKEQMIGYMLTVPGMFSSAIPAYLADSSYTDDKVLKAYDSKLASTVSEASKSTADFLKEGQGWKLNLKSGTLSGSLILADVVQRVVVGKESTQSAVTWGAGQIRDIMKG